MWNKIKQFWNWLGTKLGFIKQIEEEELPEWPYADIEHSGKVIYLFSGRGLESRMSRKFRKDD